MASESDVSLSDLIQRLIAAQLVATFATTGPEIDRNHDSDHPDHESTNSRSLDRIVLINPLSQQMTVIEGNATDFDSVLNDLTSKEGQPPASRASIDDLPILEVKGTDEIESLGGECVICLDEWRIGDVVKEMPCKHKFHSGCVDRWLQIHGSCPVCRHKMPADDLEKKNGDESRRRRRDIWITFAFDRRSSVESHESSVESHESSVESHESSVE